MSLTTKQAAELAGMTPASFRRAQLRAGNPARLPKDQWPDARSRRWDAELVRVWAEGRPGRGNWRPVKDSPRT